MNAQQLFQLNKKQIIDFIRKELSFTEKELRQFSIEPCQKTHHKRFDMSGYDYGNVGRCTTENIEILNIFAPLGIYDYTTYLFLDFYKGGGTLYFQYWGSNEHEEISFCGLGTTEIIFQILKLTVLSTETRRRRG